MDFQASEIIDVNGQLYEVGWDQHGYFSIISGERFEGEFYQHKPGDDARNAVNISPEQMETVIKVFEEGP